MATHFTMLAKSIARSRWSTNALIALWALAALLLWREMVRHDFAVSRSADAEFACTWPSDTSLVPATDRHTVLLFIHPKCPCTRATLHELDRLLTRLDRANIEPPRVAIVAVTPEGADTSWLNSPIMERASRLAASDVVLDYGGHEAEIFGVTTSGTAMLFDRSGACQYAGGLTASRGHEGDSSGANALASLLAGTESANRRLPVFGCRLYLPSDNALHVNSSGPPQTASGYGG